QLARNGKPANVVTAAIAREPLTAGSPTRRRFLDRGSSATHQRSCGFAHQSMTNRRHDDRASCLARPRLKPLLRMEPRIHAPATWKGGGGHQIARNQASNKLP